METTNDTITSKMSQKYRLFHMNMCMSLLIYNLKIFFKSKWVHHTIWEKKEQK